MAASYSYLPLFGVEPFDNVAGAPLSAFDNLGFGGVQTFGGGAEVTGDNLLITLWGNVQQEQGTFQLTAGDLLQPDYTIKEGPGLTSIFPGLLPKGFAPFAKSRTSFKLLFGNNFSNDEDPLVTMPLLAICNAPAEIKNAYKYAAKAAQVAISSQNPYGVLIEFKKSVVDFLMWRSSFYGTNATTQESGLAGITAAGSLFLFPLAKTNGADGELPVFYPSLEASVLSGNGAVINALLDEIAQGNFYVPIFFAPSADQGTNFWIAEVVWPHSVPR